MKILKHGLWLAGGCVYVCVCVCVCVGGAAVTRHVYWGAASLAFGRGIHRRPADSPAQMASNAENVSIWWLHHVCLEHVGELTWI